MKGKKRIFLIYAIVMPTISILRAGGKKVMMILDLLDDPDEMWKRFDAKLRNQVRKASKSGLTAGWSSKEGLSDFYKIFAANMRDLGSPVHSHDFFGAILDEFSDSAKIMLVRKDEDRHWRRRLHLF